MVETLFLKTTDKVSFEKISRIEIKSGPTVIEDLDYKVDGAGNILSINQNEYAYDGFNRITGAKTIVPQGAAGTLDPRKLVAESYGTYEGLDPILVEGKLRSYDARADLNADGRVNGLDHILASFGDEQDIYDIEAFAYDRNGNRTKLIQNGDEYTYEHGARNRLLKVYVKKQAETVKKLFIEYEYDANGNTTKRTIHKDTVNEIVTFAYDTLNRVTKSTEGSKWTSYRYDNAGNRFVKEGSDGSLSLYLRHGQIAVAMDVELPKTAETAFKGKLNRYVLSGDLLAGRVTLTAAPDDSVTVAKSWYHLDHLNSTKCVTNESAVVEVSYTYRAFGEQLKRLDATGNETDDKAKYSYGGKELDEATNLYYFNARYYDATIGRFISVDPVQDGSNWYVYCANNPLSFQDPTGLKVKKTKSESSSGIIDKYYSDIMKQEYYSQKAAVAAEKREVFTNARSGKYTLEQIMESQLGDYYMSPKSIHWDKNLNDPKTDKFQCNDFVKLTVDMHPNYKLPDYWSSWPSSISKMNDDIQGDDWNVVVMDNGEPATIIEKGKTVRNPVYEVHTGLIKKNDDGTLTFLENGGTGWDVHKNTYTDMDDFKAHSNGMWKNFGFDTLRIEKKEKTEEK